MSTIQKTQHYQFTVYQNPALLVEEDLTENFQKVDGSLYQLQNEENSLEDRMDAAEQDITDNRMELTDQGTKVAGLETNFTALEQRVTKNEQDIATLQPETIDEVVERLGIAEENIKNNAELIEGLEVRLTDDEDNLQQHAVRLDHLDSKTETLGTLIGTTGAEVVQMKTDITDLQQEVVKWQTDMSALDQKMTESLNEVQGLQDLVKAQTAQIATIAGQITDLQERMTITEERVINLDQRVTALENK